MAVTFFSSDPYVSYNAPALLLIGLVIGACLLWLVALAIIGLVNHGDFVGSWTNLADSALVMRVGLRVAALSLRSAVRRVASAFRRPRRLLDDYELGLPTALTANAATPAVCPLEAVPAQHPGQVYDGNGNTTPTNDSVTGRPNSPNGSAGSATSAAPKDSDTGSANATPALEPAALPWASFVAPWDLIAATATPRASSVLEAATGHTEDNSSVDVADAQI
ncbi:hypothetical protein AURDEDRAFT_173892 [Auricularia subglabra TFB-10046 SS5]|nr:hypothetical protein AURDEDRAFT_173892 [Auricularia subglabra TFB-10046 SS5]